jgi:hypothetical protein
MPPKIKPIAVLFLAHAGVAQGPLWEAWRQSDTRFAKHVHFYVHTGGNDVMNDPFVTAHRIHGADQPTRWGDHSLVLAYQEGLRHILQDRIDITMIHFVSGADIPLQSLRRVFEEAKTRFRCVEDQKFFRRPKTPTKNGVEPKTYTAHQQWHCILRDHAALIADFDFADFATWDRHFRAEGKVYELRGGTTAVPDEYYVGTALRHLMGHNKWRDEVTWNDEAYMDAIWPAEDDATGPYLYDSLHAKFGGYSLREIIEDADEILVAEALWFRKVTGAADLMGAKILRWQRKRKIK